MFKQFISLMCCFVFCVIPVHSYEHTMISLLTPSTLEKGLLVYDIGHRFSGPLNKGDQLDSFLGSDVGSNVKMGVRYAFTDNIDLKLSRERLLKEWVIGGTYTRPLTSSINAIADLEFFSIKVIDDRRQNVYYALGLQYPSLWYTFTPSVNLAYDGYHERMGVGVGLEWLCTESVAWLTEYFSTNNRTGTKQAWQTGMKIMTFGHRFDIFVHNAHQMSVRRLLEGTTEEDIYLGFRITRLLEF